MIASCTDTATFSFNRTILELKLLSIKETIESMEAFNRTILELKHIAHQKAIADIQLLIAPFWN